MGIQNVTFDSLAMLARLGYLVDDFYLTLIKGELVEVGLKLGIWIKK